jgi:hypothetical protein
MKITSLSKILLIIVIVILLLGGTLIYYSTTVTKTTETTTITETKTITTTIFLDTDGDGIPNYKEREYGTDPNKPNYLLAYALKKLPENEALKFKNVENFNESSKVLVDYFSSLPENIRNSKEVNELLNQILSDNIIDELEKNLFYDKFVFPNLPLIFDLNWFPTREKLDKIYDINVTFTAKDDSSPIAYAELRFVPIEYHYMIEKYGMRQENYPKVFPPDNERVYVLTPIDGKFDSLEERFSVQITDIIGGREYKIVVLIRDLAGNERMTEIKTPYIRQFENLGKELYDKGIIVGVSYSGWYKIDKDTWGSYKYKGEVLLGEYSSLDNMVVTKQIDLMTGYGINTIFVGWPPVWGKGRIDRVIENLINSDLGKQIRYSVIYGHGENLNLDDPIVINNISTQIKYLLQLIPNEVFLMFDNRPVIYFYDLPAYKGDIPKGMHKIRLNVKETTGKEIFIIADYAKFDASDNLLPILKKLDGVTVWAGHYDTTGYYGGFYDYEKWYIKRTLEWNSWLKEKISKGELPQTFVYMPSVIPEFDSRYVPWGDPNQVILPREPDRFARLLDLALSKSLPKKIVRIDTWDDWYESTIIEPSTRWGFDYLQIIKKIVEKEIEK